MRTGASIWWLVIAIAVAPWLIAGCGAQTRIGTQVRPIQLFLAPMGDAAVAKQSGEALALFLEEQTGYDIEVRTPTSLAAVIEGLGGAEGHAIAFLPAKAYVLAADRHGATVALAFERYGWGFAWSQFLVPCDSGITTLEELGGIAWAHADPNCVTSYMAPATELIKLAVEPGQRMPTGGHGHSVRAVYEGTAEFATTFFSPPGDPGDWQIGDPPQPAGDIEIQEDGGIVRAFVGGMRIRDARATILSTHRDVLERICILAISDPIPNEAVTLSRGFPAEARERVVQALLDYAATEAGQAALADDEFLGITGFVRVTDAQFDPIRDMIKSLELQDEALLR